MVFGLLFIHFIFHEYLIVTPLWVYSLSYILLYEHYGIWVRVRCLASKFMIFPHFFLVHRHSSFEIRFILNWCLINLIKCITFYLVHTQQWIETSTYDKCKNSCYFFKLKLIKYIRVLKSQTYSDWLVVNFPYFVFFLFHCISIRHIRQWCQKHQNGYAVRKSTHSNTASG